MGGNEDEDSLPLIPLPTLPVNPQLHNIQCSGYTLGPRHVLEPQKQMHAPLILQINLLLAPRPAATELLEAVGFCYLWVEGLCAGTTHRDVLTH